MILFVTDFERILKEAFYYKNVLFCFETIVEIFVKDIFFSCLLMKRIYKTSFLITLFFERFIETFLEVFYNFFCVFARGRNIYNDFREVKRGL